MFKFRRESVGKARGKFFRRRRLIRRPKIRRRRNLPNRRSTFFASQTSQIDDSALNPPANSSLPKYRTLCRSVVRAGIVQVRVTLSPLRAARKSDGDFGNSSEGGSGAPIEAHPVNQTSPMTASNNCPS